MTDYFTNVEPDHWANLLWAVSAPHIVRDCGLPLLPPERQAALREYFAADENRARLEPLLAIFLAERPSRRLGIYFEDLWGFVFEHHPHYQLLARNLPLREQGRTLGELDFLVRYLPESCVEHWELAVKFYLQVDGRHWVGPGLRDRLDVKLARMRNHQLPVALGPTASAELARHAWQVSRQWALVPGRLFRPLYEPPPVSAEINPQVSNCWWATPSTLRREFAVEARKAGMGETDNWRWVRLPKQAWLADGGYAVAEDVGIYTLIEQFSQQAAPRPWCIAARYHGKEQSRGFIVPEDWPHRATIPSPSAPDTNTDADTSSKPTEL